MTEWKLKTPIALLVFNRPDLTQQVFEQVRAIQPQKLLVVADGPRSNRVGEDRKCHQTRKIIDEGVDWDCEVIKNYADTNLGCKQRVASGITWIFDTVEEAIILEDDCLPHPTFFRFCDELIDKYRHDERIAMICGTNILGNWKSERQSYHFSYYGGIWGWASWRRAWQDYDVDMKLWQKPEVRERIRDVLCDEQQYRIREQAFNKAYAGQINSWDPQWTFTRLLYSGLSVVPACNLISNLGFTEEATHTKNSSAEVANLPRKAIKFPLQEPDGVVVDRDYDRKYCDQRFGHYKRSLVGRAINKVNKLIGSKS
jgi:hypothetical protein